MSFENSKLSIESKGLKFFFEAHLSQAVSRTNIEVSPLALDYVSSVLAQFHETAKLFVQNGVRLPVLSDLLAKALEADLYRRIVLLRQLGDTSLMVSGFFPEAVSKRTLNLSYFYEMGGIAYSHLSGLTDSQNIYDELSESFVKLAHLITEVSNHFKLDQLSTHELLELYAESGSETALERLKRAGIVPLKTPGKDF